MTRKRSTPKPKPRKAAAPRAAAAPRKPAAPKAPQAARDEHGEPAGGVAPSNYVQGS